jgi:hypothetical protein
MNREGMNKQECIMWQNVRLHKRMETFALLVSVAGLMTRKMTTMARLYCVQGRNASRNTVNSIMAMDFLPIYQEFSCLVAGSTSCGIFIPRNQSWGDNGQNHDIQLLDHGSFFNQGSVHKITSSRKWSWWNILHTNADNDSTWFIIYICKMLNRKA